VTRVIDRLRLAEIDERDRAVRQTVRLRAELTKKYRPALTLPKLGQFFLEQMKAMRSA
jgi:hypothetical protein